MSKTSYKNSVDAKRLQLSVKAKNENGKVITYQVRSKDGKFVKNLPNGLSTEKGAVESEVKPKGKKEKVAKAVKK